SSASSRFSRSLILSSRLETLAICSARPLRAPSEGARDFAGIVDFDAVAYPHVVVVLHADAAFHAAAHFLSFVLEAPQRFQLALEDHYVVAQHADALAAV